MQNKRVLVGEIGRPHGVRGLVHLRAFGSAPIGSYGPLTDVSGTRRFALAMLADGVARIDGVADRDAAARLTGTRLYAARVNLPPAAEDEFFLCDLEGLAAVAEDGSPFGTVRAVEDHGAGAFLVVDAPGGEVLLPFTRVVVPVVDVAGGRVVVAPPAEVTVAP